MIEFTIPSMTCGHCVRVVNSAIEQIDARARVEISLPTRRVLVESQASPQILRDALSRAGYPPQWGIRLRCVSRAAPPSGGARTRSPTVAAATIATLAKVPRRFRGVPASMASTATRGSTDPPAPVVRSRRLPLHPRQRRARSALYVER
ncbi:MAG: heavy-metal-associated domain-containing protein [Burkholderiales bacterium]|nr:heavy-metal-associated domain-containing protein [Burkholderiales bacterium]